MSNIVEYILKLKNDASAPLKGIAKDNAAAAQSTVRLTEQVTHLNDELHDLEKRKPDGMKSYFSSIGNVIPSILKSPMAILGAAAGVADIVNQGFKNSSTKLELGNLLGKESGEGLYNSLKGVKAMFGDETFDFGKKILNSGVAVDKVTTQLRQMGDIANGNKANLAGFVDAMAEARVEGKFTEEGYKKLGLLGFNPLEEIARTTGKSLSSLKQRLQEGKISVAEVEKAMETATSVGGKFHGNLDAINNSPIGKWNLMIAKIQEFAAKLGETLMPIISTVMDYALTAFSWLGEKISEVVKWLQPMFTWIQKNKDMILLFSSILGAAAIAIYAVTTAKTLWITVTGGLTTAIEVMSTAIMNIPVIGWILAGIAAVIAAVIYLKNHFTGFGKFFTNLWTILKANWDLFVTGLKMGFDSIWYYMQVAWLKIKSFGQYIYELFANIGEAIKLALEFKFDEAKAKLTAEITTSASKELSQLDKDHDAKQKGYLNDQLSALKTIAETPLKGLIKRKEDEADPNAATNSAFGSKSSSAQGNINTQKASEGVNAISGGGVKNIYFTVGKMIENSYMTVQHDSQQLALDWEKKIEEGLVRLVASVTAKS